MTVLRQQLQSAKKIGVKQFCGTTQKASKNAMLTLKDAMQAVTQLAKTAKIPAYSTSHFMGTRMPVI
ncbi:MAG: hypothetical protein NT067_07565 [Candidatus Diapherotrites archaeon]|nr:hypothetical protein [Candidatus Diapherotrites archaeon]